MRILLAESFSDAFRAELTAARLPFDYRPHADRAELIEALAQAEILIVKSRPAVTRRLIEAAPRLRAVIRGGAGIEHIDRQALQERNIRLLATPGGNCDAVGEQAVGMLLNLFQHLNRADRQLRALQWKRKENTGIELMNRTVGIIGYGHTGTAFARRLSGFGCRVLAWDKYRFEYGDQWAEQAPLEQLYAEAEIVSLHLPLTEETRHYANTAFFQAFARPIWLLNLARGEIVRTAALVEALHAGRVRGAALDVFENEDFGTLTEAQRYELAALAQLDQVIMTPHTGGLTYESAERIERLVLEAIREVLLGAGA